MANDEGKPPMPKAGTSGAHIPPLGGPPPAARQAGDTGDSPVARVSARREDLLQMQQLDPRTVDPNRHYRWVRTIARDDDGSYSVTQKRLLGYEIEKHREGGVRTTAKPDATGDGSIRMGDLVLMSCPKVLRQARERETLVYNERRIGSTSDSFKGKVQGQRGARLIGEENEGEDR